MTDYKLPAFMSLIERPAKLSEALSAARREDLRRFVAEVARQYAYQWPEPLAGNRYATGWPACWEQHDGLVALLRALKSWNESLENGEASGPGDIAAAAAFVRHEIGSAVREIARICRQSHRDPSVGMPEAPAEPPNTQPPLPGQPKPEPRPQAQPPSHWSVGLE